MTISRQTPKDPIYADAGDAEAHVLKNPASIRCRTRGLRHAWEWVTDRVIPKKDGGGYKREIFCGNCKTIKDLYFDSRNHFVKQVTHYGDGYLAKGIGRIDPDDVQSATKRFFQEQAAANARKSNGKKNQLKVAS